MLGAGWLYCNNINNNHNINNNISININKNNSIIIHNESTTILQMIAHANSSKNGENFNTKHQNNNNNNNNANNNNNNDNNINNNNINSKQSIYLDLSPDNVVYFGGLSPNPTQRFPSQFPPPHHQLPSSVKSDGRGFHGCVSSHVIFNDFPYDVIAAAGNKSTDEVSIVKGCLEPENVCERSMIASDNINNNINNIYNNINNINNINNDDKNKMAEKRCHNNGVCVQEWGGNECDCQMTSFSGDKCQDGLL
ncbi:hypothetical protein HELRODRAFT_173496 [Helobdella robusta]|uniref:EGF-like domain-containing protein n=1 Tax=Helobdella robusta TaxID=6412 RepID=T1F6W2_HELRO|nr:hypothetical protein HELRODRAFT_173496 [Helobdella robusta]ESO03793.1 hypothetical protein HELRODRAFT_173496 [Helobdella robusta]